MPSEENRPRTHAKMHRPNTLKSQLGQKEMLEAYGGRTLDPLGISITACKMFGKSFSSAMGRSCHGCAATVAGGMMCRLTVSNNDVLSRLA